jgi:hypothetical protein
MMRRAAALIPMLAFEIFAQSSPGVSVQVPGGKPVVFSRADLAAMPMTTLNVTDHDKPASFEGVALDLLLTKAGLPSGEKLHGKAAALIVVIDAADKYRAVYALAEVDPSFSSRQVILALRRDGKDLAGAEGPYRVIATGEKRAARWIRQVQRITVQEAR